MGPSGWLAVILSWAAVAQTAPTKVTVSTPEGVELPLSGIAAGKPVAIIVMKGTWCAACVAQLQSLDRKAEAIQQTGGMVAGLTPEIPAKAKAATSQHSLSLTIYADPAQTALIQLGFSQPGQAIPMPGVLFLDKCGEPRSQLLGRQPGASQDQVILETLRTLSTEISECAPIQT